MPKTHVTAVKDGENITLYVLYPTNNPSEEEQAHIQRMITKTCQEFQKEVLHVKTDYNVTEEQYHEDIRKATEKFKNKMTLSHTFNKQK